MDLVKKELVNLLVPEEPHKRELATQLIEFAIDQKRRNWIDSDNDKFGIILSILDVFEEELKKMDKNDPKRRKEEVRNLTDDMLRYINTTIPKSQFLFMDFQEILERIVESVEKETFISL